jgi:hypothetical protein
MKSVRFAYTVLILIILAVFINMAFIKGAIGRLLDEVSAAEEENTIAAAIEYSEIYESYKKSELYISLTVSHEDLSELEIAFSELIGAAKADDKGALVIAKSRLTDRLWHIKRLSGINIDSVF